MKDIRMNGDDKSGYQHLECEEVEVNAASASDSSRNKAYKSGIIKLNKPPRNSIGSWLLDAIYDKIDQYEGDKDIGVIIITSKLKGVFSDGADRDELFGPWISRLVAEKNYDRFKRAHEMYLEIENCEKPIIAAINGVTIGAGLELAMLCDLRIASEHAFFSMPEAKPELAIIPGLGGTQRLTKIIGVARAKEMLYLGKMIRASTAYEWGLINMLTPPDNLLNQAISVAKELLERDGVALKRLKSCINFATDHEINNGIDFELNHFSEIMRLKLGTKGVNQD